MSGRRNWGDEDDDTYLPPAKVSGPDDQGIKTVVEYKFDDQNRKVKVTKKFKVIQQITKTSDGMRQRRSIVKFGDCTGKEVGKVDKDFTMVSHDDLSIDHPNAADKQESFEELWSNVEKGSVISNKWSLKRELGETTEDDYKTKEELGLGGGAGASDDPNRYVPPAMRAGGRENRGAASMDARSQYDHATLRVTNISEDTREQDLRDLFSRFGNVARIYLAKDRETMLSRGFAFVSFHRREDAQSSMDKLNGYGYDHLILKIEWAKPSTKEEGGSAGGGGLSGGFTSGYGKALPQDGQR